MIRQVVQRKKKAIFILPYVSIVAEKVSYFQQLVEGTPVKIAGFYGNHGRRTIEGIDIAVCTIEKANGLINRLMEEQRLHELGIVIVDELHMLGENN